ncbi:MAG: glycosyltransferase family 2 protein, partial [Longimicrobiaceae bacterium]
MSGLPRVTIVMPSYNQARFLREAIDSVLTQEYPELELLVLDGGSTDGSVAILEEYGERLRFWSGRDRGQADAINKGFARASGEIVAWLNSDDRYVGGAIHRAVAELQRQPAAGMLYGNGEIIDEGGTLLGPFLSNQPFDLWTLVYLSDYIMQPTVFMRADALREVGGLDESLH